MKKILIMIMKLGFGGAEKSLVNFLNELPEDKYQVDLLLIKKEGGLIPQIPEYVNILDTPDDLKKLYGGLKEAKNLILFKIIANVISTIFTTNPMDKRGFRWEKFYSNYITNLNKSYDVAFAYLSGEDLYYICEKVSANKKITFVHNDYKALQNPKKYDYKYFKAVDYITTISDKCVEILKSEFPQFTKKIKRLPNITSSKFIKKCADKYYPNEYREDFVNILSIGRLTDVKGFDMAINSVAIITKKSDINFQWFIIGEGELKDKLEKQIKKLSLEKKIILLGTRDNPYPYIKNCDILVQTSRHEGKSVVLDEAKIFAKPIISTNYLTIRDQLSDKEGVIVEMTPEGIAQGIIELLDENERQKYSKYLSGKEYGNENDIQLYYNLID